MPPHGGGVVLPMKKPAACLPAGLLPVSSRAGLPWGTHQFEHRDSSARACRLGLLAGALALQAQAQEAPASRTAGRNRRSRRHGFSRQPERRARRQTRLGSGDRQHSRRGHRASFPIRTSPNPCSAFPASPSRAMRAKAGTSACAAWGRSSRACASTAWKRRAPPAAPTVPAAPTATASSISTCSPRSCSTASRRARPRRPKSRKARSAPRSTCARRVPSITTTASPWSARSRAPTTIWPEDVDPRASFLDQQHLCRRDDSACCSRPPIPRAMRSKKAAARCAGTRAAASAASAPLRRRRASRWRRPMRPPHFIRASRVMAGSTHEQERLGLTGSLQWQVNDANLINLDVLYSDFEAERDESFLEAFSFSRNAAQGGKPATRIARRRARAQWHAGVRPVRRRGHPLRSPPRRAAHRSSPRTRCPRRMSSATRWTLSELAGYSRSDFNNPVQTTITLDRANTDGYSWDFRGNDRLPAFDYGFDVDRPRELGLRHFPRRLVGNPHSSAGRRQHLPGRQDRPRVRGHGRT